MNDVELRAVEKLLKKMRKGGAVEISGDNYSNYDTMQVSALDRASNKEDDPSEIRNNEYISNSDKSGIAYDQSREAAQKIKDIIKKTYKQNNLNLPAMHYQGTSVGGATNLAKIVEHAAENNDFFRCKHCGGKITKKKAMKELKLKPKVKRKVTEKTSAWNDYVTKVSKLPKMKGKPRSEVMKMAAELRRGGATIEDIAKAVVDGYDSGFESE